MVYTRRTAMLAGASGLAAAVAYPGVASAESSLTHGGYVSAPEVGIAPTNSPATNRANLVAALSNARVCVMFPPGDYAIDNSGSSIVIANFGGELVMQPGARLVFTDNTRRGLIFRGGTGARLYGLTTAFSSAPTSRHNAEECVTFDQSEDSYLQDVRIDGSAAAGLLFWQCVRPMVIDAVITNTMADGLHFANCQDGRADHITTADTGDDGVAFLNYASGPAYTGGLASNISVTRSKSRGVAVVGQSGVSVCDVTVDTTNGHGLYCAYESSWNTRVPTDVRFERARVTRGGAGGAGDHCGIRVDNAGAVAVTGVTVDRPGAHGTFCANSTVVLSGVTVRDTGSSGFNLQRGSCRLDGLTVENANGTGLFVASCDRLEYGAITVRNAAMTHPLHRAVSVEQTPYVFGERLWIYDTQQTATGYVVNATGTQRGRLGTIIDLVNSRDLVIENPSGLSYSRM